jgi:hypothetical protein
MYYIYPIPKLYPGLLEACIVSISWLYLLVYYVSTGSRGLVLLLVG